MVLIPDGLGVIEVNDYVEDEQNEKISEINEHIN